MEKELILKLKVDFYKKMVIALDVFLLLAIAFLIYEINYIHYLKW